MPLLLPLLEAPLLAETPAPSPGEGLVVLPENTPMLSQLIQESIYQLLVSAKVKGKGLAATEANTIQGGCANPRLALFLLDLFMFTTGELADSKPEPLCTELRHLHGHLFNPVLMGLMFQLIPRLDAEVRLQFLSPHRGGQ